MSRNKLSGGLIFLVILGVVAGAIGGLLFASWALMLIFGFIHLHVLTAVAPIGYTNTIVLQLLFDMWALVAGVSKAIAAKNKK